MQPSTQFKAYIAALLLAATASMHAGDAPIQDEEFQVHETAREIAKERKDYEDFTVTELIKSQQVPGDKKSFSIRRGDGKMSLGARAAQEYFFYKNPMLLNSDLPDEYGFFKTTADIFLQSYWGKKRFNHKAIEAYFCLRHKSEWALFGKTTGTDKSTVKISQTTTGSHGHPSSKPLLWVKDAWFKVSLNAAINSINKNLHFLKIGFFPFQLGRGIALGQGYGTGKDFLGIYNRVNDFSAPGILLTGTIIKDQLEYDLYYAKYDEKGQSSGQTFASTRENHVGMRATPFRGVGKDDEVWAGQLRWTPFDSKERGCLDVNPYAFYNEASDRTVEVESDSKSMLGSAGLQIEYVHPRFEIGGECAFNFGHELLYNIDRNKVVMQNDADGYIQEVYNKVLQNAGDFPKAPAVKATKDAIIACPDTTNGTVFSTNPNFKSANDRFRPSYRNEYRGWMTVADMSFIFPSKNLRASIGAGAASGDENPHIVEENKKYRGFIGLNEFYTGERVKSVFFLDQRVLKRPLTLLPKSGTLADAEQAQSAEAQNTDASFSDLWYLGLGTTWSPRLAGHRFSINPNAMFFWKFHASPKYDATNNVILLQEEASKWLGYELNLMTEYEIFTDLKISAKIAAFFPGTYYTDVKGVPLKTDFFDQLELADKANLDSANYRLSNDTALFVTARLEYRF